MIRLIEALNYRCLRYVKQELSDFHVLVGPNASGKTTFLDVVSFLGDLMSDGLEQAIHKRSSNFEDLLFAHQGDRFELAIELEIPQEKSKRLPNNKNFEVIRYEISVGVRDNEIKIFDEKVLLIPNRSRSVSQREIFPCPFAPPDSILNQKAMIDQRKIINTQQSGKVNYYSETHEQSGKGWGPSIRLGSTKSALANLPADEINFPVSTWLRDILRDGVQKIMLNSLALRNASPPGKGYQFKPGGSNLPWVVFYNRSKSPDQHVLWIEHLRSALPDIDEVVTDELPDTRHRYLKIIYNNGLEVPSWMASDGTLRLLALTLPAYLSDFEGIYLIEEPENGIHPMAMESVYQALRSVYDAQIMLATHSPVILGCAKTSDILCFKKTDDGATDIVGGDEHPALKDWKVGLNVSDLFASGVLG